jgi:hypothetical protein
LLPCQAALWARSLILFLGYMLFFGGGTLARQLRHGPLAARSDDAQRATKGGRFALAIFVVAIPLLHWLVGAREPMPHAKALQL